MESRRSELGHRIGVGRTAEILEWEEGYVVKLYLEGFPREYIEQEARIGRALRESGLPVPKTGEVIELDGRHGIVFERLGNGKTMLREFASKPWRLSSLVRMFTRLHLEVHGITIPGLPPLPDRLARRIRRITTEQVPNGSWELVERAREAALAKLDLLPQGERLCHGDFHPDNIILSPRGPFIIDWSEATKGDPAADVARTRLLMSLGAPVEGRMSGWLLGLGRKLALSSYLKSYLDKNTISRESIDAWQLPVTLARLAEGIAPEGGQLIALIDAQLNP